MFIFEMQNLHMETFFSFLDILMIWLLTFGWLHVTSSCFVIGYWWEIYHGHLFVYFDDIYLEHVKLFNPMLTLIRFTWEMIVISKFSNWNNRITEKCIIAVIRRQWKHFITGTQHQDVEINWIPELLYCFDKRLS